MRPRRAIVLAAALAGVLALAALPPAPPRDLEAHAAQAWSAQMQGLLARLAGEDLVPPGVLPSAPTVPPLAGGPWARVQGLAGDRPWDAWVPVGEARPVDLDADGTADLELTARAGATRVLAVAPLHAVDLAWAAWLEDGGARWGLAGSGLAPLAAVGLAEGELHLRTEGAGSAWHAAFASAGSAQRALAWLAEPGWNGSLSAAVGGGHDLRVLQGAKGGLRAVLVEDGLVQDLTLRDLPAGARVLRDAAGALRYRAPAPGGSLAYEGDAAPLGQQGTLAMAASPLPQALDVEPAGEGFVVEADRPTDLLLDWTPPWGDGVRVVGNDVQRLEAQPGAAGGVVMEGPTGKVAVGTVPGGQGPQGFLGEVVDLDAQGAASAGEASPWPTALAALALGACAVWAVRPRKAQRQVE